MKGFAEYLPATAIAVAAIVAVVVGQPLVAMALGGFTILALLVSKI